MTTRVLQIAVFVAMFAFLSSGCTGLDKVVRQSAITDGLLLDKEGNPVVVDAKSGKRVLSCKERAETKDPCKASFLGNDDPNVRIIRRQQIEIIDFVGSTCRTYVSRVTGKEYEVCR